MEQNQYDKQAEEFLASTGSTLKIEYLRRDYFWPTDEAKRNIYKFTLQKNGRKYSAEFGQSIAATKTNTPPRCYDILACLSGNEPPSDLQNFRLEFGYEVKQLREAERAFKAVQKEYAALSKMYSSEQLQMLAEIR